MGVLWTGKRGSLLLLLLHGALYPSVDGFSIRRREEFAWKMETQVLYQSMLTN